MRRFTAQHHVTVGVLDGTTGTQDKAVSLHNGIETFMQRDEEQRLPDTIAGNNTNEILNMFTPACEAGADTRLLARPVWTTLDKETQTSSCLRDHSVRGPLGPAAEGSLDRSVRGVGG